MSMDIKTYNQLKTDGLINKVQKTNIDTPDALTYAVYIKKFEVQGSKLVQLADEVQSVTHKELQDKRAKSIADSKEEVSSIDTFIADAVNGV